MTRKGYQKYGAIKTIIDGFTFDSKAEARRYSELKLLERAKCITDLELQPSFLLQDKFKWKGAAVRAIKYIADFKYYDIERKEWVVEDVKGVKTEAYKIKAKMFKCKYPEYWFKEVQ